MGYPKKGPMPSKNKRYEKESVPSEIEEKMLTEEDPTKEKDDEFDEIRNYHKTTDNKSMNPIFEKIEMKFFSGKNTALKVYREFDTDNDGFYNYN